MQYASVASNAFLETWRLKGRCLAAGAFLLRATAAGVEAAMTGSQPRRSVSFWRRAKNFFCAVLRRLETWNRERQERQAAFLASHDR